MRIRRLALVTSLDERGERLDDSLLGWSLHDGSLCPVAAWIRRLNGPGVLHAGCPSLPGAHYRSAMPVGCVERSQARPRIATAAPASPPGPPRRQR
jgi:hypothetical protein